MQWKVQPAKEQPATVRAKKAETAGPTFHELVCQPISVKQTVATEPTLKSLVLPKPTYAKKVQEGEPNMLEMSPSRRQKNRWVQPSASAASEPWMKPQEQSPDVPIVKAAVMDASSVDQDLAAEDQVAEDRTVKSRLRLSHEAKPNLGISDPDEEPGLFLDERLFPDYQTRTFSSIEEAKKEIVEYISQSGFYLVFTRSERSRLVANCKAHKGCPFLVRIRRRRADHELCIKTFVREHRRTEVLLKAEGGVRTFKRRLNYQVVPGAAGVDQVKNDPVVQKTSSRLG